MPRPYDEEIDYTARPDSSSGSGLPSLLLLIGAAIGAVVFFAMFLGPNKNTSDRTGATAPVTTSPAMPTPSQTPALR